jgi:protein-tyrosine phosphatase
VIDWHCHILPGMDDGSHSAAESVSMINMQMSQGIDTVIATPHFYANDETVAAFLERRSKALALLKAEMSEGLPEIRLGAEVRYYQGISRMENVESLRIEGSKLLLLEMPVSTWTEYMVKELIEMSGKNKIQIVLDHVERYFSLQKLGVWESIFESGILPQANASFFTSLTSRRKAITLLKKGNLHCVGSDGHNMTSRPPQIEKAFAIIQKKLGEDYIHQMNEFGYGLLGKTNNG